MPNDLLKYKFPALTKKIYLANYPGWYHQQEFIMSKKDLVANTQPNKRIIRMKQIGRAHVWTPVT